MRDDMTDATAIRDIPQSPSQPDANSSFVNRHSSSFYDLQGRRLSAPPARGMYIQDKRVEKKDGRCESAAYHFSTLFQRILS